MHRQHPPASPQSLGGCTCAFTRTVIADAWDAGECRSRRFALSAIGLGSHYCRSMFSDLGATSLCCKTKRKDAPRSQSVPHPLPSRSHLQAGAAAVALRVAVVPTRIPGRRTRSRQDTAASLHKGRKCARTAPLTPLPSLPSLRVSSDTLNTYAVLNLTSQVLHFAIYQIQVRNSNQRATGCGVARSAERNPPKRRDRRAESKQELHAGTQSGLRAARGAERGSPQRRDLGGREGELRTDTRGRREGGGL